MVIDKYLAEIDPVLLKSAEGRKTMCVLDPMMFAIIYLSHHLKNDLGQITACEVHEEWSNLAKDWVKTSVIARQNQGSQGNQENQPKIDQRTLISRDSYVAPRNLGKSTWFFLILPLWAAAFGHKKFAAAFADSGLQAEIHLKTFRNELDVNKLLRADFPALVNPQKRRSGQAVSDSQSMIVMRSGFIFSAKGIDASNLGLKVDEFRPDLIIFDDIEPGESNYSPYQAAKRLRTVIDDVLPMNLYATVLFVGTVTMAGGITHQLVQSVESKTAPQDWIVEEGIRVHYYPPIVTLPDGSRRSIWPEKWSLPYLDSVSHTRGYAKNFLNKPVQGEGEYWQESDFTLAAEEAISSITRTVLSIDPATTTKQRSDYTGIVNIAFAPGFRPGKGSRQPSRSPKCIVQEAVQVRLMGEKLRNKVLRMIESSPTPISLILLEVNQGGETWLSVFHDMPVPVKVLTHSVPKELRVAKLLAFYQRHLVEHRKRLPTLEEQMTNYPDVMNDDLIDGVSTGVRYYARKRRAANTNPSHIARNRSYV